MTVDHVDQLLLEKDIWRIEKKNSVTFLHADNIAFLRWIKEEMMMGYFHIGIVDPPYGISVGNMQLGHTKDSKPREYERGEWDNAVPTQEYWDLLRYACRKLIVWGGNYFTKEINWSGRCFVVWDKMNDKMSFASGELALTDFDRNAVIIRRPRNAACVDDDKDKRHDTQKPVYLYDYLHLNFVERGHRVLDTHGGSFSHAIAAFKNNVNLTIMDKTQSYFEKALEVFDNASMKGRLLF